MLGEQHRNFALDDQLLDQRDQFVALTRPHAGGRFVHQQETRLVGERDSELDAFDVTVSELAARPVGGLAHADLRQQVERALAIERRGRPPQPVDFAGIRNQRHLHVLGDRHRAECGRDLKGAADTEPPDRARRQPGNIPVLQQDFARIRRELAVDDVEARGLAGAVRADHGEELALADLEADVVDRTHAAEGLGQRADLEHAHGRTLRHSAAQAAGDALRERQHQQQDDAAQQRAPIFGLPHHRVLQGGKHRRADDRPGQRLDAAEQHHHQAVDRAADADGLRRDRTLGKGEQSAGHAANAPAMAKPSQCTRLTSMPMASARSAESRPARMA